MIRFGRTDLKHVQDDLRILGIILVPAIVQSFSCAGEGDRRNQARIKPGLHQAPGQWPMIMAGRFEANNDRSRRQSLELCHEAVMLDACVIPKDVATDSYVK
ncbi:hypothetical protein SXCC_00626 [Gluconacetobacter sp. SXCC-1]|nr:hypothetical protein SXCC_00626 [Gluconacetobacter sp. SXCC-1]